MLWKDCLALSRHKWNILIQFRSRKKIPKKRKEEIKRDIEYEHTLRQTYICVCYVNVCARLFMCVFVHVRLPSCRVCVCVLACAWVSVRVHLSPERDGNPVSNWYIRFTGRASQYSCRLLCYRGRQAENGSESPSIGRRARRTSVWGPYACGVSGWGRVGSVR